jgi:hypothetical protein
LFKRYINSAVDNFLLENTYFQNQLGGAGAQLLGTINGPSGANQSPGATDGDVGWVLKAAPCVLVVPAPYLAKAWFVERPILFALGFNRNERMLKRFWELNALEAAKPGDLQVREAEQRAMSDWRKATAQ